MKKSKDREGFNFYKSYYTVLEMLNDTEKLEFLIALFNKQFYNVEPVLSEKVRMVYMSQQHSINKQVEGWEHKTQNTLSGEPPIKGPTEGGSEGTTQGSYEHPTQQVLEQVQVEVKVLEQVKVKEKVLVQEKEEFDKDDIDMVMINHTCSKEEAILYLKGEKQFPSMKKENVVSIFEI